MANNYDVSYATNTDSVKVKNSTTPANNTGAVDTSYQSNTNVLYGGHDAAWWQKQYASQTDAESQAMVKKAADYYGYKIPETVSQSSNGQVNNSGAVNYENYSLQTVNTVAAENAQGQTYAENTNQGQEKTPVSQYSGEPIDSYEEFLRKRAEGYQETLDKTKESIEQQKQNTIDQAELQRLESERQAEIARQREVADSRSSYELNKATYGTQAEQLGAMGLSGSGYGEYLDAKAYATQRAEQQQANAQAEATKQSATYVANQNKLAAEQQANADKLTAELTYAENMANNDATIAQYKQQKEDEAKAKAEQAEAERKAAYAELLSYANNGAYDKEQLSQLGTQYGLDENQIKSLTDAADTYKTNKQAENYNKFLSNSDNGFETIKSALNNGDITQEQYNSLLNQYQTNYFDNYSSYIDSDFASVNTSEIDNAVKRGYITQEHYNTLKQKYNSGVASAISAATIFYSNGSGLDENAAKTIIDELKASGWLSDDNKTKLDNAFNSKYKSDDDDGGGGGCYAKGTLITMADGSTLPVENVREGDNVLVFNHKTGNVDKSPVSLIFYDGAKEYKVLKLNFEDKESVEVLYGHGFFDTELKKYVLINSDNVEDYIGHKFYHIAKDGENYKKETITLTGYDTYSAETECYSVLTAEHVNSIANGILTVTDDGNVPANLLKGFYNVFELDDNYRYDEVKMAEDINNYGLFTYEDWQDYVSEEEYKAFNGSLLKVAIGKGLVTFDEVVGYIKRFLQK